MKMVVAVVMFALLIGILDTNAETDPNDATALRVMYNSLNSPQQLIKWTANGDPCDESWKGIKCSNKRVTEIDISGLGLTGSLGYQVDKLTAVTNFDISNNNFWAVIPYTMPPNVQKLNIANNGFSGGLPYYISTLTSLRNLNVSHNQLDGQVNDMFGSLSSLSTLDFSFNSMSGDLPNSFSSLISMNNMYLQNNQFTGKINVLANLPLDNLNIENNLFNGWIPQQLKGIKNLKTGGNGNTWQSGPAPPPPPGTPPVQKPNRPHKPEDGNGSNEGSKKSGIGAGGIIGILVSVLVIGAIVAIFIMKRRSRKSSSDIEKLENQPFASLASQEAPLEMKPAQNTYTSNANTYEVPASINLKPPPIERQKSFVEEDITTKPIIPAKKINIASIKAQSFSIADLQIATDSFNVDNLLGEGSVGRVYRALFNDGKVFAVKKINSSAIMSSDSFLEMVLEISRLHHQNVTELIGYCSEHGQHLLVYEYLKSGSLNDILHLLYESKPLLTWNNRVKIALGTARAVEYLHEVCSPSVIHKNLKSENILLDSELNPHLSDSGLATLIQDVDQAGAGYSAPEVAMSGQYTIKSDVYSFGVVMLELLTGRKPFDNARARSEQSLVRWATPQLHDIDALDKMVDPMLEGLYPVKSLSRFADVIALCVQSEPEFRPPMSEVVEALVRLVQRANMSKRTVGNDQNRNESVDSPRD